MQKLNTPNQQGFILSNLYCFSVFRLALLFVVFAVFVILPYLYTIFGKGIK